MSAPEAVELVHKVVTMIAARRAGDVATLDRVEREAQALVDRIRDEWVGRDAAAAAAEDRGRPPGRRPVPFERLPGRSAIELVSDALLEEMARLKRADGGGRDNLPAFLRHQWMLRHLTGWGDGEIAGRLLRAARDLDAEGRKAGAG